MQSKPLKIGTRGSPLALAQAEEVRSRLVAEGYDEKQIEISVIKTTGDQITHKPLAQEGGKGLFTKEIETALLVGEIDLAVHSGKDMPTQQPDGLELACFLPREDAADGFISNIATTIDELPHGAVVGTSSLRRRALLKRRRPDIETVALRGLVATRLAKLDAGKVDATLLAVAGLNRLNQGHLVTSRLATHEFLPAPAQGAIGIEIRQEDDRIRALLMPLNDPLTAQSVIAERALLEGLDGSCQTPVAALATIADDQLSLHGQILLPDGSEAYEVVVTGQVDAARDLGLEAAALIRLQTSAPFWRKLEQQFHELAAQQAV